jgi:hypothetical protein
MGSGGDVVIWNCPWCGDELYDLKETMKKKIGDEESLQLLDSLLKYYCGNCNDFYDNESLKEEIFRP